MPGSDIVVGLIGYGYWGPNLARNLLEIDGFHLEYICDVGPQAIADAGKNCPGVRLVTDAREVIEDGNVDAVVVASPAATHHEFSRAALLAGKHVLVEKPMSLGVEEGRELARIASAGGLVLMVGHLFIYHPAVRFMKEYLATGQAGEVFYTYSRRLNLGRIRHDENCLWSLAPHDLSIMLYLLESEPDTVIAWGASYLRETLEDVVFLTLRFPGGQIGNVHVSWLDPRKERIFTVVGSEKMLVFDDMSPKGKVKIFDKRVFPVTGDEIMGYGDELRIHFGEETEPDIRMEEPLRVECAHFRDSIQHGSSPVSDGRQGLAVLRVLDAASRSIEAGGRPAEVEKE